MTLYEIDLRMMECFDKESGEIIDQDAFEQLVGEKENKVESVCLAYKNLTADVETITSEIKRLNDRRNRLNHEIEFLKDYVKNSLGGEKYKSALVSVYYVPSEAVSIDTEEDNFVDWALESGNSWCLKRPEISKTELKKALKKGMEVPNVHIEKRNNIVIK